MKDKKILTPDELFKNRIDDYSAPTVERHYRDLHELAVKLADAAENYLYNRHEAYHDKLADTLEEYYKAGGEKKNRNL